jgi:WD40 repeat protein
VDKSGQTGCRYLRTFDHAAPVTSVAWSPDGRFALSGSGTNVRLWDITTGDCLRTFNHPAEVSSVAWSPDGRFALSACGGLVASLIGKRDKNLRLWDISSGDCLRKLEGHTAGVNAVAWSPDGRFALSGGDDGTIRLWAVATGRCLYSLGAHTTAVNGVAWNTSGHFALSRTDEGTLSLWAFAHMAPIPLASLVPSRLFTSAPQAYQRLIAQADRALESRDIATAIALLSQARAKPGCRRRADALKLAHQLGRLAAERVFAEAWERKSLTGHSEGVFSVAWSPDGRSVLSGGNDATLRLWDIPSGRCLHTLTGHRGGVNRLSSGVLVAWSPDGRFTVSGCADEPLWLWEIATARRLRTFQEGTDGIKSVAWSPDGRFVLSTSSEKSVRLWDTTSGGLVRFLRGHDFNPTSAAWSPDGRLAASASWDSVRVWDIATGGCLRSFKRQSARATSVAWSPDGRFLLCGEDEGALALWDIHSSACLRSFTGHAYSVTSVAWSRDGRFAVDRGQKEGQFRGLVGGQWKLPGEADGG